MSQPKICCVDIESTNLVADFGTLLCVSWTFVGEDKIYTIPITAYESFTTRPWDDKQLVKDVYNELMKADMIVTWFGTYFDIPFLQTRLLKHGLPVLPPIPHLDGWKIAKKNMRLSSNRMKTVSAFLEEDEKTPVDGDVWVKARAGHGPSVKYVVDHCERDVRMLERVYHRIKGLADNHLNLRLITETGKLSCPICASERIQRRGKMYTKVNVYWRYQCLDCGKWSRSRYTAGSDKPDEAVPTISRG